MAPFGKGFLKARQKNRTKDTQEAGQELQVTVCQDEKVVCGVTKHTTCADMIQALLEDHRSVPESKRLLHGEPEDFCLVERWKGFDRALPPLTRILRLWYAWGDQRPFVQFVLVKTSDFVPRPTKKAAKSKGARPKRWEHPQPLPAEKQKRVVKKAFRKLEKLHRQSASPPAARRVDRMVKLILDQDHTIQQQIQRMRELDSEIERLEMQTHGERAGAGSPAPSPEQQLREHLHASDGVQQLDLQVQMHQQLILQLSRDIDAELRRATAGEGDVPSAELQRLRAQLERSVLAGVALHGRGAEVDQQLKGCDAALASRDQECRRLAAQLSSLQIGDGAEQEPSAAPEQTETQRSVSQAVQPKHSLPPSDATDTDSDTGISSTHSQDSLSPCLDAPPPLDSDL